MKFHGQGQKTEIENMWEWKNDDQQAVQLYSFNMPVSPGCSFTWQKVTTPATGKKKIVQKRKLIIKILQEH